MTNAELITLRTNELAAALDICDQQQGMTTPQKLADISVRFGNLSGPAPKQAAAKCLAMKALFEELTAA